MPDKMHLPACLPACLAIFLLVVCSEPALSQIQRDPASQAIAQQHRAAERDAKLRSENEPISDVRIEFGASQRLPLLPENETPCVVIQSVTLQGDMGNNFPWVLERLGVAQTASDFPQGRCLGGRGIQIVADRLQNALISQGYLTTRIIAEPQDLKSGLLVLTILPGRINAIRWKDGSDSRASLANTVPISRGDILNLRDVEQALENFRRIPTADADIQIEPASEPGLSDVLIQRSQSLPLRLNLTMDDAGADSTGKYQGSATVSLDNSLGLSDLLYLTHSNDLGGGGSGVNGTAGYIAHYSLPLGYWTLAATVSRNRYRQTVVGLNQNYLYSGTSEQSEIKLSRVVHRDMAGKITASLKAFQRKSNNFIDDTEVQVQRRVVGGWELGLNYRGNLATTVLDGSLVYRRGTGAFGSIPAPEEAFGEGNSHMQLLIADANLSFPFALAGRAWTYSGNWRAQSNFTPLTPQDRFTIGGRYSVRGFDGQSSLSTERGWLLRNEMLTPIGTGNIGVYLGLDHAELGGASAGSLIGTRLSGMVIGLRGALNKLQFDVFAGIPVRKPPGFITDASTAGFNLNLNF